MFSISHLLSLKIKFYAIHASLIIIVIIKVKWERNNEGNLMKFNKFISIFDQTINKLELSSKLYFLDCIHIEIFSFFPSKVFHLLLANFSRLNQSKLI